VFQARGREPRLDAALGAEQRHRLVGTSPFTYTNTSGGPLEVVISGGGVSKLQLSRDNTLFYDTGSYYGMFTLAAGDKLRVTYIAAPTMTAVTQ
jgi:hypothetical protein